MYYPVETRITPLTTIRRERLLPTRGQVLVRPGEVVGANDVVARCQLPGDLLVVDVARALGVRRERVGKFLRKAVGDPVQADELLAAPRGLLGRFRRGCRAPVDGRIAAIRAGVVLIEAAASTLELTAHIRGQVTNVMPNLGVVISTSGALIQGVWGSGGEAGGVLKVLVDNPQKPLRARAIDVSCHGTLLVGGRLQDKQALQQAIEARVRGIIVGSVSAELIPDLRALPLPVLITEGFGTLPMSPYTFSLLQANLGREAMISADTQTRWDVKRPEVVIPLRAEEMPQEKPGPMPLEVGTRVRVVYGPHLGAMGHVTDLPALPQVVESGGRLSVAEVELEKEGKVLVPLANLELIR